VVDNMLDRNQRTTRSRVNMAAVMTLADGGLRDVVVEDLSIDGACVRGYLRVGDAVAITLPRIGTFHAAVCWARGGRAGLRFANTRQREIHHSVFNEAES